MLSSWDPGGLILFLLIPGASPLLCSPSLCPPRYPPMCTRARGEGYVGLIRADMTPLQWCVAGYDTSPLLLSPRMLHIGPFTMVCGSDSSGLMGILASSILPCTT